MNITADRLAQVLESELGIDWVTRDSDSTSKFCVDGKQPTLVCSPATPPQVAAVLRVCAEADASVIARGGGTAASIGNPPREASVVMDTTRLDRIVEHDHANLTVTAQSGMTLAALQQSLSRQHQFLAFDPPFPARAALGGIVAANLNGPRRSLYGSIRDCVIGMKIALVTGEHIKAGGKVVKNVAGYDMCKLFVGSLGTLGVITEVTVRVAPVPETAATVMASGNLAAALRYFDALSHSPLLPAAAMLANLQERHGAAAEWQSAIWCEGFEKTVARHLSDGATFARDFGLGTTILRGRDHEEFWDRIQNFPLASERCVYRVTLPRAALGPFVAAVSQITAPVPALLSDMAMGTMWLSFPASRQAAAIWPQLTSRTAEFGGHAILFSAPHELKKDLNVWGPAPAGAKLMRKLKQQFDPKCLLNPGRFLDGM